MVAARNQELSRRNIDNHSLLCSAWVDYQHGTRISDRATHLRVGFHQRKQQQQQQQKQKQQQKELLHLNRQVCFFHQTLKQVQLFLPVIGSAGVRAFGSCFKLERVEFVPCESKEETNAETDADHNASVNDSSALVRIEDYAFGDCKKLQSVVGLEHAATSLTSIGNYAFNNNISLTNADFLASLLHLEALGSGAFFRCALLTTIDMSNAILLTELKVSTFFECKALTTILLPPRLQSLDSYVFVGCHALTSITFPKTLESINVMTFKDCALEAVTIPASVRFIGRRAFLNCRRIKTVTIESSRHLAAILNSEQFHGCTSIQKLEFPSIDIPCSLWPILLERFLQADSQRGLLTRAGIRDSKQHLCITWNFLRASIHALLSSIKSLHGPWSSMKRKRQAPPLSLVELMQATKPRARLTPILQVAHNPSYRLE